MNSIDFVRDLIGQSKIDDAIDALKNLILVEKKNDLLLISAKWSELKRKEVLSLISYENHGIAYAKIVEGLNYLVSEVEITENDDKDSGNSESIESYFKDLENEVFEFSISGLVQNSLLSRKVIFEKVYIQSKFELHKELNRYLVPDSYLGEVTPNTDPTLFFTTKYEGSEDLSFFENFTSKLLVLGNPGEGKSLLCKHKLNQLITEFRENRFTLPIYINCNNFSRTTVPLNIVELNDYYNRIYLGGEDFFKDIAIKYLRNGWSYIIIDGIDEIEDRVKRLKFCQLIDNLMSLNSDNKFLITCRVNSINDIKNYVSGKFTFLYHSQFSDDSSNKLSGKICDAMNIPAQVGHDFIALLNEKKLTYFKKNPLYLTNALLVYINSDRVPITISGLYLSSLKILFQRIPISHKGRIELNSLTLSHLSTCAYLMTCEEINVLDSNFFDDSVEYFKDPKLIRYLEKTIGQYNYFESLILGVGLFEVVRGFYGGYYCQFIHKSFKEYLSGRFLVDEGTEESEILEKTIFSIFDENAVESNSSDFDKWIEPLKFSFQIIESDKGVDLLNNVVSSIVAIDDPEVKIKQFGRLFSILELVDVYAYAEVFRTFIKSAIVSFSPLLYNSGLSVPVRDLMRKVIASNWKGLTIQYLSSEYLSDNSGDEFNINYYLLVSDIIGNEVDFDFNDIVINNEEDGLNLLLKISSTDLREIGPDIVDSIINIVMEYCLTGSRSLSNLASFCLAYFSKVLNPPFYENRTDAIWNPTAGEVDRLKVFLFSSCENSIAFRNVHRVITAFDSPRIVYGSANSFHWSNGFDKGMSLLRVVVPEPKNIELKDSYLQFFGQEHNYYLQVNAARIFAEYGWASEEAERRLVDHLLFYSHKELFLIILPYLVYFGSDEDFLKKKISGYLESQDQTIRIFAIIYFLGKLTKLASYPNNIGQLGDADGVDLVSYQGKLIEVMEAEFGLNFKTKEDFDNISDHIISYLGELNYKVTGKDITGRVAWYFCLIQPSLRTDFLSHENGASYNLEDYGRIIRSGYGERVPNHIVDLLKERFGFDNF